MLSKLSKIIFSIAIVSTVLFFTGGNLVALFGSYLQDDQSMISIARDQFCIQRIHTPSDLTGHRLVVLRLDDVQAYSWRGISIQMIQDAQRFNAPIVAWVIPKNLTEDHVLTRFLERENCNIEIAMHGWDHSGTGITGLQSQYITEFGNISYVEARRRIAMAKEVLEPLSGKPITTFIPPFNIASPGAVGAIRDEWIRVLSSIGTWVYDYHSTTYNFDKKRIVPATEILTNCAGSFAEKEPCVIMMHPQDYANIDKTIDEDPYNAHYIALLKYFSDMGVVFVTFDDLIKNGSSDS
jgi:Uncharacterized protein conserved in bacteria (DUF2334)